MRIVLDLQGAQSIGSRTRGIGRYTSSLAQAIARRSHDHEIVLALNGCFPEAIDEIRTNFDGLVDPKNMRVWYAAPQSTSANGRQAQEKIYEAFLASLQPDVVHVGSLFEGLGDASVTSVGSFAAMPTAVTLYDLIPLIHPHPYLDNTSVRAWYMKKITALQRADMWFAISESSRQEGITQLALDPDRCVNVSTAAYDHFKQVVVTPDREQDLRQRYGLHKPFVMYTGGIDHRKNIEGLIKAFARLRGDLRRNHQLAIVCSARPEDRSRLLQLAREQGLDDGAVVVTGFVPEPDLVNFYNLCALFVFPSWHEGFGLPALEAMQCGAAVIGANTSSLPEVIGRDDALFDPRDEVSIERKMAEALTDQAFRAALVTHGLEQAKKFSWDKSAKRVLAGLEALHASSSSRGSAEIKRRQLRPRLAYISPLPPERSGIADYSAELLPELARYYEIDLITELEGLEDTPLAQSFAIRDIEWFRQNANAFDRVLYHFGNSDFHEHMFALAAEIPGVVVLHDFFLGNVQINRERFSHQQNKWTETLYESHGYSAVKERFETLNIAEVVFKYPSNFDVIRHAQGVIVHSPYSLQLADKWIEKSATANWTLIPLLRKPTTNTAIQRSEARARLGLRDDDILVSAFGMLGPTKLNHRLIQSWLASSLAKDPHCRLVFVGDNDKGEYGVQIQHDVTTAQSNIDITGWVDKGEFQDYLRATDVAVQLRTNSRGETSAAVLDAMNYQVATIANANGSMAFLPENSLWLLPDEFTDAQLIDAIETLRAAPEERKKIGKKGHDSVCELHAPEICARRYFDAVEAFASKASRARDGLIRSIGQNNKLTQTEFVEIAKSIAATLPLAAPKRQLLVDVSELVRRDSQSGIQRLVKSMLQALFAAPPDGYRIEPVYAVLGEMGYKYARQFTLNFLGCPAEGLQDAIIDARAGDIFVGLDLQPEIVPLQGEFFQRLRHIGVRVEFVVYDLLPVILSSRFAKNLSDGHERWLKAVAENHGALCISQAVADEFASWLADNATARDRGRFDIRAFHLGADLASSKPSVGLPANASATLDMITSKPSFLMVGTVEPRKGHEQVLDAFEKLWSVEGLDVSLVIVGKQGWMVDELVKRLHNHREQGTRLFWLEGISDEYLERVYASASCLIAASEGEGFGLPLIEAARHKLPIISRDLPVFREVAGTHAMYFTGNEVAIAKVVTEWIQLSKTGSHPSSDNMPYLTWQQSAEQFKAALFDRPPMTRQ
ncbi:Glycosyltransferase involved in cell wall bisynthesis [Variovorax sp. YR634]|jgi:glycosyltransferase involved in cell wall biosynthesis|uniref:glycosyltransferase n=1 Tax=Variovorax sp. YR634 TaxID=1884385 RepID=UPI00089992B7|nr:glycosyltransferase [Variovorax sp. YR634]SDY56270.1 Glycosyltransferase involved in cell wall bisynthesis [Variovorax sp. YR634]